MPAEAGISPKRFWCLIGRVARNWDDRNGGGESITIKQMNNNIRTTA
jgi:hypothetical protein